MTHRDLSCEGGFEGAQVSVSLWPVTCGSVHCRFSSVRESNILWYQFRTIRRLIKFFAFKVLLVTIAVLVIPSAAE